MTIKTISNILALLATSALTAQTTLTGTITHNGLQRDYRLYVPAGYNPAKAAPLVFNLHGFTSNALEQEFYAGMNAVADTAGFLVCYPNGIDNSWNVGWFFGSTADDVGFLSALIDELSTRYTLDSNRIYACGMSNGGFMSYRLACELNDRIAAVASVTGSMVPAYRPQCNPGRPVAVMEIHGTADPVVPYNGLTLISLPIDTVVRFWVGNNQCALFADTTVVPDVAPNDGCTAIRIDYRNCNDNTEVALYRIQDGGHTWPGADTTIGVTNQDFDASVEIWRFFSRFRLNMPVGTEQTPGPTTVQVFPNPVSDRLYVRLPEHTGLARYAVFNSMGALVLEGSWTGDSVTITVGDLADGLYWMLVDGEHGRIGKPFVKQ
ncbi:MAG: PHB depolymerase family esterase [Saprospiraceae bacterium]|nr:PHB depolymerase family esterase [Saprospiraceae bacterium]